MSAESAYVAGVAARGMLAEQRRETHGFLAEFGAHGRLGGRAVVALVEEQIERAMNGGKPRGEVLGVRDVEQLLRSLRGPSWRA